MHILSRRTFLGGTLAAAGLGRFGALAGGLGDGKPLLRFGVLSDVHLNANGDETHFLKALAWFRDQGVDAVMIAGDIADSGRIDQLECCASCWFRVFPDNKAPDGRTVERLFVYGNHCVEGWTYGGNAAARYPDDAAKRAQVLGFADNRKLVWERLFDEPWTPVWKKVVKGVSFIGAHWENHCPRIEPYMREHASEIDPSLPFFYVQHSHPRDTCYGPWAWGHDPGYATRALSPFPNAVAFSGHSHYTLTDERSVWQGAFTSIGTATLRRTSLDYACVENSNGNDFDAAQKAFGRARSMRPLYREDGKQGQLVEVYADRLVIRRRDFVYDQSLGADWTVPIPTSPSMSFSARAAKRTGPAFAAGVKPTVLLQASPPACASSAAQGPHAYVAFPAAKTTAGCRVFAYEVTARAADGAAVDVRRVMAPGFNLPETQADRAGECIFPLSLFAPGARIRFEVRAEECFGAKGAAIVSDAVEMPAAPAGAPPGTACVDAGPEGAARWRTCTGGRTRLNWTWPDGAHSAKLTVLDGRGREEHLFGTATDSFPWDPADRTGAPCTLTLDFYASDAATGAPMPGRTLVARRVGGGPVGGTRACDGGGMR